MPYREILAGHDQPSDPVMIAVNAVKKRDRNFRRAWILAVAVMLVATGVQTLVVVHLVDVNNHLTLQNRQISTQISCALAEEAAVTTDFLRQFAHRFGADLPPPPGLPHQCGGNDPIILGTPGPDTIHGTGDPDWINGYGGGDLIYGHGGGDTLLGGKGPDVIWGGVGIDYEYGGEGDDELHAAGDEAVDHLFGGDGFDTCYVRPNDVYEGCERVIKVAAG